MTHTATHIETPKAYTTRPNPDQAKSVLTGTLSWREHRPSLNAARGRKVAATVLLPLIPIVGFIVAWHYLTVGEVDAWLRFNRMPAPAEVWSAFVESLGSSKYYDDLYASLKRILMGFVLAGIIGVALGMMVGRSEIVRKMLRPFIEIIRPIPAIALVPLTILLFPSSEQGIVFITFFAAFFPVLVSTIHAMESLPKVWEEAAMTMGAVRTEDEHIVHLKVKNAIA